MAAATVLADLTAHGVTVWLSEHGTLEVDAPRGVLTEAHRAAIRQHKSVLVALLMAPDLSPCAVCGETNRWQDGDVWRCVACETAPLTAQARAPRPGAPPPALIVNDRVAAMPERAAPCLHTWEQVTPRQARCVRCGFEIPGTVSVRTDVHDRRQEAQPR